MYVGPPHRRFINEIDDSPLTLHCPCGAVFGCRRSSSCPDNCPWGYSCHATGRGSRAGGSRPGAGLRVVCPACRVERQYVFTGYPAPF